MKKVIDESDSKGKRKHRWKSIEIHCCIVNLLPAFVITLNKTVEKREKMQVIDDYVYDKFEEVRDALLSVHDGDMASEKSTEDSLLTFEC